VNVAFTGGVVDASAAVQTFLKFPGITGDSVVAGHEGEVRLTSMSANASRSLGGGCMGGGAGKFVCGQITLEKKIDASSPQFLGLLFTGQTTPGPAKIVVEKTGDSPFEFYKIELGQVSILSIAQSDAEGDEAVKETIVLKANQYRYTYTPQTDKGLSGKPVVFGWDCVTNKPF
jgi:type VI secretion system secreted protein Hcp